MVGGAHKRQVTYIQLERLTDTPTHTHEGRLKTRMSVVTICIDTYGTINIFGTITMVNANDHIPKPRNI